MRNLKKLVASVVLAFLVTACGLPPIGSWGELLKIDPLKTDFNHAYVVMRLPDHIVPSLSAVTLYAGATLDEELESQIEMGVKENVPASVLEFASSEDTPGYTMYAFAMNDRAVRDAAGFQEEAAENKRLGIKRIYHFGFHISQEGLCRTGEFSQNDKLSLWLKTEEMSRLVPLLKNKRLEAVISGLNGTTNENDLNEHIAQCT